MTRIRFLKLLLALSVIFGIVLLYDILIYSDGFHIEKVIISTGGLPEQLNWEDYEKSDLELLREGPGEGGERVFFNESEKDAAEKLIKQNGFNGLVSDKISVHRSVPDLRIQRCKSLQYDRILPPASIIIPFYNEHWSTLIRTVHSLLYRAPQDLVHEVILVDDFSTKAFLKQDLDDYVNEHFQKVKIIRNEKREGLIKTRIIGAKAATGIVLIFIDSHCEAGINWLPPLLQPIKHDYQTITCPFIDVIDGNDFSIVPQDDGRRGAFDWKFNYKRLPRLPEDKRHPEKPFDSPVMAGGLFAISSQWFWELGGYDDGLEIWGGEQYELSFKTWMCGGHMVDIPCSRIAHIYRKFNPFGVSYLGNYVARNHKRVAEVWMDDWKEYIYQRSPRLYASIDPGNITKQIEIRKKLQCKSFDWFMNKVAFDLLQFYPIQKPMSLSIGRIISESNSELCIGPSLDKTTNTVGMDNCDSNNNERIKENQKFNFTWELELKLDDENLCMDYSEITKALNFQFCHGQGGNQRWIYNPYSHQIIHEGSRMCIDSNPDRFKILIKECSSKITQKWKLEGMNKEIVKTVWDDHRI